MRRFSWRPLHPLCAGEVLQHFTIPLQWINHFAWVRTLFVAVLEIFYAITLTGLVFPAEGWVGNNHEGAEVASLKLSCTTQIHLLSQDYLMAIQTDGELFLVLAKQVQHYIHNAQIMMVVTFGKDLRNLSSVSDIRSSMITKRLLSPCRFSISGNLSINSTSFISSNIYCHSP